MSRILNDNSLDSQLIYSTALLDNIVWWNIIMLVNKRHEAYSSYSWRHNNITFNLALFTDQEAILTNNSDGSKKEVSSFGRIVAERPEGTINVSIMKTFRVG